MHSTANIELHRSQGVLSTIGRDAGVSQKIATIDGPWKTDFSEAKDMTISHSDSDPNVGGHACASESILSNKKLSVCRLTESNSDHFHCWKDGHHRKVCQILCEETLSSDIDLKLYDFSKCDHEIDQISQQETSFLSSTKVHTCHPLTMTNFSQTQKTNLSESRKCTTRRNIRFLKRQNQQDKSLSDEGLPQFKFTLMDIQKTFSSARRPSQPSKHAKHDKHDHARVQTPEKGLTYLKNERVVVPESCERRAHSRGCASQTHRTMNVLAPFAAGTSSPLIWLVFSLILSFSSSTALPKHQGIGEELLRRHGSKKPDLSLTSMHSALPNYGQNPWTRSAAEEVGSSHQLLSLLYGNDVITNDRGFIQESRVDDLLSPVTKEARKCCGSSQESAFSNRDDLRSKLTDIVESSSSVSQTASSEKFPSKSRKIWKKVQFKPNQFLHKESIDGLTQITENNWQNDTNVEILMSRSLKQSVPQERKEKLKNHSQDASAFASNFLGRKARPRRIIPRLQFPLNYNDTSVPSVSETESTNRILKRTPRAILQHIFENFTKTDLVTVAGVATDLINWFQSPWTHSDNSLDRSFEYERDHFHGRTSGPRNFSNEQSNFSWRKLFTGKHDEGDLNFTESSYIASNRIVPSWPFDEEEYADDPFQSQWDGKEKALSSWKSHSYEEQDSGHGEPVSKPIVIKHRDLIEGRQLFGLGFFTGTLLNFIRDPIVLFLIFWFNLWISYAGIAAFYNGFTFVTSFIFGGTGGTTTTVSGSSGTTPTPVLPASTTRPSTSLQDPSVAVIIAATASPPKTGTSIASPPSVSPDGLDKPSPPSTITDEMSSDTELADPLGFSTTARPAITKPPDLASQFSTVEVTLTTDDILTLSTEFAEVTTAAPFSYSTDETSTITLQSDDSSAPTDIPSTDTDEVVSEIDGDTTPSAFADELPTILTGTNTEMNATVISIPDLTNETMITENSTSTEIHPTDSTMPSNFNSTPSSPNSVFGVNIGSSTTLDPFTFYTTQRRPITKPSISEPPAMLSTVKIPSGFIDRPASTILNHSIYYTTKGPISKSPTTMVTGAKPSSTTHSLTGKPNEGFIISSPSYIPVTTTTLKTTNLPGYSKYTSKPFSSHVSSSTEFSVSATSLVPTNASLAENSPTAQIFVTMPASKNSTHAPSQFTMAKPESNSQTTKIPLSLKPIYFMTPAYSKVGTSEKPSTVRPLTLTPLLLNLTNSLAIDLLGGNTSQVSFPVKPSINFKPTFPYKPFLNQSIILTDSFLQHINETREKVPALTTEIIRNLTTLLSHIYNGSSEVDNSSEVLKPWTIQAQTSLLNSSDNSQYSSTSIPLPDMSVITTHLQSVLGDKKPLDSEVSHMDGTSSVSSGDSIPNTPSSSEAPSLTTSPHTEAPILVLDRCLSSGGSLAQCLELSQLYGKLFAAVMGASEIDSSSPSHISGIPISSNSTLIQNLLNNGSYSHTSQAFTDQAPSKPGFLEDISFPNKQDSIVDVINNQLLPGGQHPYPDQTGGFFAVGHGNFESSSHKLPNRPVPAGSSSQMSSNGISQESLDVQASLDILNAGKPPTISLSTPHGTLLVAATTSKRPEKPSLSVPLISDHELIPLPPLPQEPLYGTTASGSVVSDFDFYQTGFADNRPDLTNKEPASQFAENSKPSITSLEEYYQVYWPEDSLAFTPGMSVSHSASTIRPQPQSVSTSTLSPHIQALAKKHPHANVIIGPPPKHFFQKTKLNNRLG